MTNRYYDKAIEGAQTTVPMNLLAGAIAVQLVDLGAYTPNFATDEFLSDIPLSARLGAPALLTGKSLASGVFDAADIVDHDLGGALASSGEALVLVEMTGDPATSRLKCFIDTDANGAISVAAGKTLMSVAWSNGSNKICKL